MKNKFVTRQRTNSLIFEIAYLISLFETDRSVLERFLCAVQEVEESNYNSRKLTEGGKLFQL